MSYDFKHLEDDCDKCCKNVGKANLTKVPFVYKDMNDTKHKDLGRGYRQYWVCKECKKEEDDKWLR